MSLKKLTKKEMHNECRDMKGQDAPDTILPGLDSFILEWNIQAKKLNRKQSDELIAWARV